MVREIRRGVEGSVSTHRTVKLGTFPTTIMDDVLHADVGTGKQLGTIDQVVIITFTIITVVVVVVEVGTSTLGPRLGMLVLGGATTTPRS